MACDDGWGGRRSGNCKGLPWWSGGRATTIISHSMSQIMGQLMLWQGENFVLNGVPSNCILRLCQSCHAGTARLIRTKRIKLLPFSGGLLQLLFLTGRGERGWRLGCGSVSIVCTVWTDDPSSHKLTPHRVSLATQSSPSLYTSSCVGCWQKMLTSLLVSSLFITFCHIIISLHSQSIPWHSPYKPFKHYL